MIRGFEDVKELDEILDATNEDWPVALNISISASRMAMLFWIWRCTTTLKCAT